MEPSVKGTIFANVVGELNELLATGKLTEAQLDGLIKPDERELLDRDIPISAWYPVELYDRLLQLYALSAPGSSREFLVESGRASARRIVELGIYSQLDDRTEGSWENRIGRILVSLSGAFFSFGSWEWEGMDGEGFSILVRDAAPMSDALILRTSGFIEELASRAAGGEVALSYERPDGPDLVRFRAHRIC